MYNYIKQNVNSIRSIYKITNSYTLSSNYFSFLSVTWIHKGCLNIWQFCSRSDKRERPSKFRRKDNHGVCYFRHHIKCFTAALLNSGEVRAYISNDIWEEVLLTFISLPGAGVSLWAAMEECDRSKKTYCSCRENRI